MFKKPDFSEKSGFSENAIPENLWNLAYPESEGNTLQTDLLSAKWHVNPVLQDVYRFAIDFMQSDLTTYAIFVPEKTKIGSGYYIFPNFLLTKIIGNNKRKICFSKYGLGLRRTILHNRCALCKIQIFLNDMSEIGRLKSVLCKLFWNCRFLLILFYWRLLK